MNSPKIDTETIPMEPKELIEKERSSIPATLVWADGRKLLLNMNGEISGGFWAVMGPSGSGKSTLLNALSSFRPWGREKGGFEAKRS